MSLDEITFPDVNYGEDNKQRMKDLTVWDFSPFFGCDYWEIFIFCMSYAYAKGISRPENIPGAGTMPSRAFLGPARDLMRALAIDYTNKNRKKGDITNPLDIIKNPKEYVKICERFAFAGFEEIYTIIQNIDGQKTKSEDVLMNLIKEINSLRDNS